MASLIEFVHRCV